MFQGQAFSTLVAQFRTSKGIHVVMVDSRALTRVQAPWMSEVLNRLP